MTDVWVLYTEVLSGLSSKGLPGELPTNDDKVNMSPGSWVHLLENWSFAYLDFWEDTFSQQLRNCFQCSVFIE